MKKTLSVSIIGASGYSGLELTKILLRHPHVTIDKLFANTSAGKRVSDLYPWLDRRIDTVYSSFSVEASCSSDIVFVALPSGEAMSMVPDLLKKEKKVIDLGGDFRLQSAPEYQQYYHRSHSAPELLPQATYGLSELNGDQIRRASLLANPGCYPTGAIIPLVPLLKNGIIRNEGIVVSSLSGVSGAGRSSSSDLSFVEVNESVKAYKVGNHQHNPEINQALRAFSGKPVRVSFVPHLIPITRGLYSSIYASLASQVSIEQIADVYNEFYADKHFVRVSASIPEIRNVVNTNFIDIGFRLNESTGQLSVFSVIDNLIKGAAGQAVQNMNLMCGFDETEGLI